MKENLQDFRASFQRMDVYRVARELVVLVHTAKIGDAELRDQATRAAKSVLLRLSEGLPHDSQGMRRKYFNEANGCVHEVLAALDVAAACGVLDPAVAQRGQLLAIRVKGMLRKLRGF
jgi:four helix bundle protein